jgi:hypothetical protein
MRVKLLKIKGYSYRVFEYTYAVNEHIGFTFNQLCEVGEPWQNEAKALRDTLLLEHNGTLSTLDDYDSLFYSADIMYFNKG